MWTCYNDLFKFVLVFPYTKMFESYWHTDISTKFKKKKTFGFSDKEKENSQEYKTQRGSFTENTKVQRVKIK